MCFYSFVRGKAFYTCWWDKMGVLTREVSSQSVVAQM